MRHSCAPLFAVREKIKMHDLNQKIVKLRNDFDKVKSTFRQDFKKVRFRELEAKSTDPNFWQDQESAKRVMQEMENLRKDTEARVRLL